MKSLLLTLFAGLGLLMPAFAQVSLGFHYQAVARDANGAPIENQNLTICLAITTDSIGTTALYQESHVVMTDEFGMFTLVVGRGQASVGIFDTLRWGEANRFLQIEMDQGGGSCQLVGTNQLWAVPYAMASEHSRDWVNNGDDQLTASTNRIGLNPKIGFSTDSAAKLYLSGAVSMGNIEAFHIWHSSLNPIGEKNLWIYGSQNRMMNVSIDGKLLVGSVADGNTMQGTFNVNGRSILSGGAVVGNTAASPTLEDHMIVYSDGNVAFEGGQIFVNTTSTSGAKGIKLSAANSGGNPAMMFGEVNMSTPNTIIHPYLYFSGYKVGIGTNSPTTALDVNGETTTKCLTITGGCDIIEYVQSASGEQIEAGEVVVIDPHNPKQVRKATRYRQGSVVGIISGAGGINPGLALSQEGVLDGDLPMAIAGRVYVKAHGKIRPGDQLTSSNRHGYATKLRSRNGQGAVIGKALTALDGEGHVMVLVNLH